MSQSPQYNQSRQIQRSTSRGNAFTRKLSKNYSYLKTLVPYLDNPSEEGISETIKITEQHQAIKLWNEEDTLAETPKKPWKWTEQTSAWETFNINRKKLFVLYYTNIGTVKTLDKTLIKRLIFADSDEIETRLTFHRSFSTFWNDGLRAQILSHLVSYQIQKQ